MRRPETFLSYKCPDGQLDCKVTNAFYEHLKNFDPIAGQSYEVENLQECWEVAVKQFEEGLL